MSSHSKEVKNKSTEQPQTKLVETGKTEKNEPSVKKCFNCNQPLIKHHNAWLCPRCNPDSFELGDIFRDEVDEEEYIFIECPGATLYEPGTNNIIAGVKFIDEDDSEKGYEIVSERVYAPTHTRRRRIRREARGKIRRCQGCQDYTVRMRRREGPDFFIPSVKHPNRKKLKSISHQNTP
ncbi:MAG: hypothetical protein JXA92_01250 [candidate division Zixibacteria bacterium]|nr:hypothetical protein [candidate division Zixibacteria bacterium]